MKNIVVVLIVLTAGFALFACSSQQTPDAPNATTTNRPITTPTSTPTLKPTKTPYSSATITQANEEPKEISPTQTPTPFPLSEPGPYQTDKHTFTFVDASRDNREIKVSIWYPAVPNAGADLSGAPYPLILGSSKVGSIFGPHFSSHGFVMAGVQGQDSSDRWGMWLIDYPLDIVFALDQIAANSPEGLAGVIDTDHVGATGYSFDGYTSLALSGARIDPDFYLAQCAGASNMNPTPPVGWIRYNCDMVSEWDEFSAHAGETITSSNDGLWQPMTDQRIQAVVPMAPEGAWLFGERGLAAVNRPTLIIGATKDGINIYNLEAVYIYEHLGTPERYMISFVGEGHMMIFDSEPIARMKHFATAFFGYYLQGNQDYAEYFSEEFVNQNSDLAWGVYTEK